jgi:hypothetical protein
LPLEGAGLQILLRQNHCPVLLLSGLPALQDQFQQNQYQLQVANRRCYHLHHSF